MIERNMDSHTDRRTEDGGSMTTDKVSTTAKNMVPHIRFQIPVREGGQQSRVCKANSRNSHPRTPMIERSVNAYFRGEPDVLQVKDVVRILHCSKNTVYALIKSGTLECVKVGRNLLIPKTLLVEFLMRDKNFFVLRPDPPRRR